MFGASIDLTGPSSQPQLQADANEPSASNTTSAGPLAAPVKDDRGRILNPRSCVTCRRRKVKCDKTHPCHNCTRQHIECVFPTPGRAPRKLRKATDHRDVELLARLRRLEGVVKRMGVDPSTDDALPHVTAAADDDAPDTVMDQAEDAVETAPTQDPMQQHTVQTCATAFSSATHEQPRNEKRPTEGSKKGGLEHRFGRLVVNEGKSRYVNSSFWANLSTEVEDLKGILNEASDDDDDNSPTQASSQSGNGWVFSFSSQNVDLLSLHPIPVQLEIYWDIYKENVDPLVKVLHIPSLEPTVLAAASHLANLSKSFEALMFAIYYGAATSLSPEDCLIKLGEERSVLLARYKFAIEQALARANFLVTEELVVLQAFVIFLICLRRNNDARVIWTLTGLVVRIAQTIGIHRDGSHFGLAPFEVETRRRLWWQVCILDVRASEDHGCDPTITEQSFDTKMPLNVNDVDLEPQMKTLPSERKGCTDMTFSLIRFEVANTFRRLNYIPPGAPRACGDFFASISLEDKERWITECHERLEDRYLKHCDMNVPIYWVTATVARLMMSKMWLMVYHPFQRQDGGKNLSSEIREKLFITSLENIEYSILLETEARTMQWGWLFRTYMQWHAFAFILVELCHRTRGELVDRAWVAVENSRDGYWGEVTKGSRVGHLWRPLTRLLKKATMARNKAVLEDQKAAQSHRNSVTSSVGMSSSTPPGASSVRQYMIRAPLSAAQLQRFMSPPIFGNQPIDSTTLMRSPKLEDTILLDDNVDISVLLPELVQQSPPQGGVPQQSPSVVQETLDQQRLNQQSQAAQLNAQNAAFGTSGPSPSGYGPFGSAGMSRVSSSSFPAAAAQSTAAANGNTAYPAPTSPFSFGSAPGPANNLPSVMDGASNGNHTNQEATPPGFSPFDSTGEMDWANWDDLVRQFGMDTEKPPGDDWGTGPGWGHGAGMGGGVLF